MVDDAGSDPSDDESDPSDYEFDIFSDDDSDTSESDDDFDPSWVFLNREKGRIPRNVRRVVFDRYVKFIPDRLFKDCDQLESVLLHEGLLRIGVGAFSGCTSLRSIRIPSTVTKIGQRAFHRCSNLATAELPGGLEEIDDRTFYLCMSLEEVNIPASVTRIGNGAFFWCIKLASIELCEGLRIIGRRAFYLCMSLKGSLRVPSSVDEIGDDAFYTCNKLTSVQLSEDLTKMKRFAFGGCTSLECFEFVRLSERMEPIRMDHQTKSMFEGRLREMTIALTRQDDDREGGDPDDDGILWEKCKESLERAHESLSYLELKEAALVLELALWKGKIEEERGEGVRRELVNDEDGGQDLSDAGREKKRPEVVRNSGQNTGLAHEGCRVKCGAGIVLPEVLQFFTCSPSWPQMDYPEEGNVEAVPCCIS